MVPASWDPLPEERPGKSSGPLVTRDPKGRGFVILKRRLLRFVDWDRHWTVMLSFFDDETTAELLQNQIFTRICTNLLAEVVNTRQHK